MREVDDKLISILDDYAEFVLWKKLGGDMFSGAINQIETIDEIQALISEEKIKLLNELINEFEYGKGIEMYLTRIAEIEGRV